MLKALLLDMDETLCDTKKANAKAKALLAQTVDSTYPVVGVTARGAAFADNYVSGIYRQWSDQQRARYTPIVNDQGEVAFRIQLIRDLLQPVAVSAEQAQQLQNQFDGDRLAAFDFYPGIKAFLRDARQLFTLVVITNGPEFSQIPKVEAVDLAARAALDVDCSAARASILIAARTLVLATYLLFVYLSAETQTFTGVGDVSWKAGRCATSAETET